VAVAEVLRDAVAVWRPVARARGRELRLDWRPADAAVRGDRLRLAQACGNLLANAIEHGQGPVRVRGHAAGARVRIEVMDDGPGLPAPVAALARRARAGRGRRGRGLAIAAEIAARHGGRLAAAPAASGGRIVLELPAAGQAVRARPA
jgi:signal transduction histidine kinase